MELFSKMRLSLLLNSFDQMRKVALLLTFVTTLSGPLLAQSIKDTLYFKNGTIIIGEIKRVQLGVITFDPDDANDITVQLRKVKAISGKSREFRIETIDHQVLYGLMYPTVHDGFVNITGRSDSTLISLNNITSLYPVEKSFLKKINGYLSAGYSYTKSSKLGRLNFDGKAVYQAKKVETGINFSFISTNEEGEFIRDREDFGFPFSYYFHSYWFAGSQLNYQRNLELGIKSRWQQGLGIGNKLITTKYVNLIVFGGMVLNEETPFESTTATKNTEGTVGIRFNIFKFSKPELSLSFNQKGYASINEERYRLDGDLNLTWEMIEDLDLNISFYSNFDSRPPTGDNNQLDYGTVLGVRFDF